MQGDPLSPMLFTLQALPLIYMIQSKRATHAIPLTPTLSTAPIVCFADDSTLIAKSQEHAVDLYNIANAFCKGSGAKLHPDKSIAIAASPGAPSTLSNGIRIANEQEPIRILGVLFGTNITRQQQTSDIMNKLLERCRLWSINGRTVSGRATIVQSILLSTTWYVLSALSINVKETQSMQTMMENFVRRAKAYNWNMRKVRSDLPRYWLYAPRNRGGLNMTEVITTLQVRKLALIRSMLSSKSDEDSPEWHVISRQLWLDAAKEWIEHPDHLLLWHRPLRHAKRQPGDWNRLSPWWQSALELWFKLQWTPAANSMTRSRILRWPVWRNRLLQGAHGRPGFLHQSATSSNLQQTYQTVRSLGFLSFVHFANTDGDILDIDEIIERIEEKFDETPVTGTPPDRRASRALAKQIRKMWENACNKWVSSEYNDTDDELMTTHLHWQQPGHARSRPFLKHSNKHFRTLLSQEKLTQEPPHLLKVDTIALQLDLNKEQKHLSLVAPSRQNVTFLLVRRGLPLGITRVAWAEEASLVECPICHNNVETYKHLFWDCTFAKLIWRILKRPWNVNHRPIQWVNIVSSAGVSLGAQSGEVSVKLWAVVRACTLRMIWQERNNRIFNPTGRHADWKQRAAQAAGDIRAHWRSALRRTKGAQRESLQHAVDWVCKNDLTYQRLMHNGNIFQYNTVQDNYTNTSQLHD